MRQQLSEEHRLDENGKPAGGHTEGVGISIDWQNGPLGTGEDRVEPNGAFVEGVIDAAIGRLRHFQDGEFACEENEQAIGHLEDALACCDRRTADREARGVEGTHTP